MDQKRLLELAGVTQLNEAIPPYKEPKEIDFEEVKKWLKKKYGDSKDVDGMSKMELTKAAVGMKESIDFNVETVNEYINSAKENMSDEDWAMVVEHISAMK